MSATMINNFVTTFLGDNEELIAIWKSAATQKQLKAVLAGKKANPAASVKRAKSAYLWYCDDERAKVKEANPDMKATDVTIELGKRWSAFKTDKKSASARAVYDKARYEAEKDSMRPTGVASVRRAKSSYIYFCEANRPSVKDANPDMKATEITAELGKAWNALKADKKKVKELDGYVKKAASDKARYEAEKAAVLDGGDVKKPTVVEEKPVVKKATKKATKKTTTKKK